MRPLHVAVFLTPLIALYELGSAFSLPASQRGQQTIKAHRLFEDFFHTFGVAGLYVPAAALLTVLIVWHVLIGDRWRIRLRVLGMMFAESVAWTLPLLVLSALHSRATHSTSPFFQHAAADLPCGFTALPALIARTAGDWLSLPQQARITIAIGAGLYEEMLFRLVGVALIHFILADLLRMRDGWASVIAVVGAAVGFALYHQFRFATGDDAGAINWPWLIFLTLAGLYFGMLYILRGFGIVVATHAFYDILVLVLLM